MAKLQNRMLQSCSGSYLACSPFGYCDQLRKCSHYFKLKKPNCIIGTSHLKVGRNYDGSSSFDYGIRLVSGFSYSSVHVNFCNYGSLVNFITRRSSPSYGAFSKRFFSKPTRVESGNDNVGFELGASNGKDSFSPKYDKLWSQAKALSDPNRNIAIRARTLATKGQDTATSGDQVVKGRKKKAVSSKNEESKAKHTSKKITSGSKVASQAKKSKATKTDKAKEASISDQAVRGRKKKSVSSKNDESKAMQTSKKITAPSKVASQAKKSKATKSDKTKEASKKTSEDVPNGCATLISQSNVKSKESRGKLKSVAENNGSLRKQKPQEKEKVKPSRTARANKSKKVKSVEEGDKPLDEQEIGETRKTKPWIQKALKPLYPPSGNSVVVVESLTKAKVIQGYLGDGFEVLASHGHVRDLASRTGSVRTNDNFSMVWEVPAGAWTHLKSIEAALSRAENLILASDPDREGEAIAWHIFEMLQLRDALREGVTVARVVFHEITEASIKRALQSPREIDENLVHAYLARRALDYLIGFNISPLLWKKLPGCRSAGRVQSAALSLICDREMEIDVFKPQEYWTVDVEFEHKGLSSSIPSRLTHFGSEKLSQFSISSQEEAANVEQKIKSTNFRVVNSKTSQMRRHPPAPFITSTLQQEAANKLHFRATHTMKLAQKLYEGVQLSDGKAAGLITYIRTDGLHISDEAVKDIRYLVTERYGSDFAADGVRKYLKKVKNAQEAHEAIRPTDIRRLPSMLTGVLDEDSLRLYTLIWARTLACQMESAIFDQIQLDVGSTDDSITFRSSCSKLGFPGYQAVYKDKEAEAIRYKENEDNDRVEAFDILNSLKPEEPLYVSAVEVKELKTQPPSRYSESSLVKKLEELGIGRPSTYASTLKVLQDRKYVTVKSRVLYPEFRGRMVSAFLSHLFSEVSDYSFTADMEAELDNVSAGLTEWKSLLGTYWTRFSSYCAHASDVPIHQVEKMLEKKFSEVVFSSLGRECPSCTEGTLIFKVSKHGDGFFIGCDQHPVCRYTANRDDGTNEMVVVDEPKLLGSKPNSDDKIFLKKGPYGLYVQLGENRKGFTPQRASIPQNTDVNELTLEDALMLLSYPKTLGSHPIDGQPVLVKISKNGFSLKYRRSVVEIPEDMNPDDLTMEKAMQLLDSQEVKRFGRPKRADKLKVPVETM